MDWLPALAALPWILLFVLFVGGFREPRPLPAFRRDRIRDPEAPRRVAIVLPARNEARDIDGCLASLAGQSYPDFSIVVVDDRSTDDTAERARRAPRGNAREIRVVEGEPLPPGWFGKPWACHQGAQASDGELILFTDADTRHDPDLLERAVAGFEEDAADILSIKGWQELGSFGERLVQPQIFALLALRYPRLDRPVERDRWKSAIANGQFILVRRDAYVQAGGHEAVRDEVVEDLRLAQVLTRAGLRLSLRGGEDAFSTRMYHSLREVVNGWTKNLAVGARQASGWWAPFALPGILTFLLLFWIVPPAVLMGVAGDTAVGGSPRPGLLTWAAGTTALNTVFWAILYRRFGVSPMYAFLHPAGAGVAVWIVLRSWHRGERRIEWKGRRYERGEFAEGEEGG